MAILLLLLIMGVLAIMVSKKHATKVSGKNIGKSTTPTALAEKADDGCCGQHAVCARANLWAVKDKKALYFDDEELDRFIGIASCGYNESQVEEFREVLYTMCSEEVPQWLYNLQQRGVEVPDELKDEVLLLIDKS